MPYGTGTSLEGHAVGNADGITISLEKFDKILKVNAEDFDCRVQANVSREQLNENLKDKGVFFPIDPGANAALGGMAACSASGTMAVKYGTMRTVVMGLTVVLANGDIIKTGTRAKKSSAGYNLTNLFVGSEGTLGIITEITLKLHGIPEKIAGGRVSFPNVKDAADAVIMTIQSGIPVARIELLDKNQVKSCNNYSKLDLPEEPMLLVEFHGSESSVKEQSELFGEIASDNSGKDYIWTADNDERNKIWKARHDAYWANMSFRPGTEMYATDVCVPISKLSECIVETIEDLEKNDIVGPLAGHAGDGNFHVSLMIDTNKKEELSKLDPFLDRLSERAIRMEGTCTGEHGIGQGKRKYMYKELGNTVDFMKDIKKAFDPNLIMNPGKLFL